MALEYHHVHKKQLKHACNYNSSHVWNSNTEKHACKNINSLQLMIIIKKAIQNQKQHELLWKATYFQKNYIESIQSQTNDMYQKSITESENMQI